MRASVIAFGSLLIQQYAHNQQYGHAHRHNTDINNHSVRQKLQLNGYGGQVKAHLIVLKSVPCLLPLNKRLLTNIVGLRRPSATAWSNMRMAHVALNLSRFPSSADSGKNRFINESTTFTG